MTIKIMHDLLNSININKGHLCPRLWPKYGSNIIDIGSALAGASNYPFVALALASGACTPSPSSIISFNKYK